LLVPPPQHALYRSLCPGFVWTSSSWLRLIFPGQNSARSFFCTHAGGDAENARAMAVPYFPLPVCSLRITRNPTRRSLPALAGIPKILQQTFRMCSRSVMKPEAKSQGEVPPPQPPPPANAQKRFGDPKEMHLLPEARFPRSHTLSQLPIRKDLEAQSSFAPPFPPAVSFFPPMTKQARKTSFRYNLPLFSSHFLIIGSLSSRLALRDEPNQVMDWSWNPCARHTFPTVLQLQGKNV